MRILIVEDEPKVAGFLKKGLEEESWTVNTAINGIEALNIMQKLEFDALIVDIMMPRMDGLQFLAALRADLETSRIPVIILTALGHGIRKSMRNLRAFTIISKPFSPQLLMEEVREAMMVAKKHKPPLLAEERHA